jgi:outer membrane protein assembly factor BamA
MNILSKHLLQFLILLTFNTVLYAQITYVTHIDFVGHEVTKDYIIAREIQHPVNVPLDSNTAIEDRNRIENLGIFSYVEWTVLPNADGSVTLRYIVIESWRYLPGLMPLYEEGYGWSVSGGVLVSNFRGRNESLSLGGQFGGRIIYGVEFLNPWMFGDHISFGMGFGKDAQDHPFLPYSETSYSANLQLGRFFMSDKIKTRVKVDWEWIELTNDDETIELDYIKPEFDILFDTRDIYVMPTSGILLWNSIESFNSLNKEHSNWVKWFQSYSYFRRIAGERLPLVAALNISGLLTFGTPEPTEIGYLGGAFTVRGFESPGRETYAGGKFDYRFGFNAAYGTIELRQIIIPKYVTSLRNEFGVSITAFFDFGVMGENVEDLFNQPAMLGTGIGLQFLWPVVQLVRLDYGWAFHDGKAVGNAFHIGFGQKF